MGTNSVLSAILNTKETMKTAFILLIGILFFTSTGYALAQPAGGSPTNIPLPNPLCEDPLDPNCSRSTPGGIINEITNWLFAIATPIAALLILVGAYQILFSGGNEEQFRRGKRTITYTVIGYVIIFLSRATVGIVKELLSG
jgi:hypothetical protein